jgi:hypothetical protein
MERSHLEAQALRVLEHIEILNHHYRALLDAEQPEVARVLESAETALRQLLDGAVTRAEPSNGASRAAPTPSPPHAHANR